MEQVLTAGSAGAGARVSVSTPRCGARCFGGRPRLGTPPAHIRHIRHKRQPLRTQGSPLVRPPARMRLVASGRCPCLQTASRRWPASSRVRAEPAAPSTPGPHGRHSVNRAYSEARAAGVATEAVARGGPVAPGLYRLPLETLEEVRGAGAQRHDGCSAAASRPEAGVALAASLCLLGPRTARPATRRCARRPCACRPRAARPARMCCMAPAPGTAPRRS
jgi:hypothetical protein